MTASRKPRRRVALAAALVPAVCTAMAAGFHFPTWEQRGESVGSWPELVVIADVTGDGRDDVVLATSEWREDGVPHPLSDMFLVYAQQADGTLAAPAVTPHGGDLYAGGLLMQAADLNRDGKADIVLSHVEGVSIAIATGSGFDITQVPIHLPRDFLPFYHGLAVGDLDGDRKPDIVRQMADAGTTILLGDGTGGVRGQRTLLEVQPGLYQKVRIEDATGDGLADMVTSSDLGVHVHAGRSDGTLDPPRGHPVHRDGYGGMAIADVTRDGRSDIVVTTPSNLPAAGIHVFEQQSDGTLASPPWDVATYEIPETLLATDVDHNGYEDLLVLHGGWMKMGFYLQDRTGLSAERLEDIPYASRYSPHGLAIGDVNGDGCTDVAIADYNHGVRILHGRNCFEPWSPANDDPMDFDGDGTSDILWRSTATGHNVVWGAARSSARTSLRRVADTDWRVAGAGNFDGDGRSDLFWRHAATGANAIWLDADSTSTPAIPRVTDRAWVVAGIGDLDADGLDDLVWRHPHTGVNTVWYAGGTGGSRRLVAVTDIDWQIVGVADFDADGRDDLFWRHRANGRNVIWPGGQRRDMRTLPRVSDIAWQVAGTGDFDGDGRSDVLWRHAFEGRNVIWLAADPYAKAWVGRVSDPAWTIAGVGDYAGDGKADIFWRNRRTGANALWQDGVHTRRTAVSRVGNLDWAAAE